MQQAALSGESAHSAAPDSPLPPASARPRKLSRPTHLPRKVWSRCTRSEKGQIIRGLSAAESKSDGGRAAPASRSQVTDRRKWPYDSCANCGSTEHRLQHCYGGGCKAPCAVCGQDHRVVYNPSTRAFMCPDSGAPAPAFASQPASAPVSPFHHHADVPTWPPHPLLTPVQRAAFGYGAAPVPHWQPPPAPWRGLGLPPRGYVQQQQPAAAAAGAGPPQFSPVVPPPGGVW